MTLWTLPILAVCRTRVTNQLCNGPCSLQSLLFGSVEEHRDAESEGLRFDSSWGLRVFSLSHACDKTKNIFPYFFTKLKTYHLSHFIHVTVQIFVRGHFLSDLFQVIKYDFKAKCVFLALMVRRVILACSDEVCDVILICGLDLMVCLNVALIGKNYSKVKKNFIYFKEICCLKVQLNSTWFS